MGIISVLSNLCPERMKKISNSFATGQREAALSEQQTLLPLIDAMFAETNPAPMKYALARLGLCAEEMRLPMSEVCEGTRRLIDGILKKLGLI